MSEFTNGVLFLNLHIEIVQELSKKWISPVFDYIIHEVNDKWGITLLEDFGLSLSNQRIRKWLHEMSEQCPFLIFDYGEDHGWSYKLFNHSNIISKVDIGYELVWSLAYDFLEIKYPHLAGDPSKLFDTEDIPSLYEQIRQSEDYQIAIENMYSEHVAETFSLFNMSVKSIDRLKQEISADVYKKSFESMRGQVDIFKKILGFEEVSWMSYWYFKNQQNESE